MNPPLRIGTRGSQLALWQANWVKDQIRRLAPHFDVQLDIIKTKGDKILDVPLSRFGGKGLFVKEIEEALLDGRVDLAVHSMKDMPSDLPTGLIIAAIPPRENPFDILAAPRIATIDQLPQGARVGTSSLRRSAQLLHRRPDLTIVPLRGNLDTRLKKLENGDLDAIILAAAGLVRLGLADRIRAYLSPEEMLPAVGQGALCIETRAADPRLTPLMAALDHADTRTTVTVERAFLARLEGGCQVPIAAHAQIIDGEVKLTGLVAEPNGSHVIRMEKNGPRSAAAAIGRALAEELLQRGADAILERFQHHV